MDHALLTLVQTLFPRLSKPLLPALHIRPPFPPYVSALEKASLLEYTNERYTLLG